MDAKGQVFSGCKAGLCYDLFAPLFGMNKAFFHKAVQGLDLRPGMRILDLGCGTGKLLFALAEKAPEGSVLIGCDYSPDQLARAEAVKRKYRADISFVQGSMDELDFPDAGFDLIMSSMALHAVNPAIRQTAIANAARMLKDDGIFLLVDIAAPRPGILSALFSLLGKAHAKDGHDPDATDRMIAACGFTRIHESYLNSVVKKQILRKHSAA